MKATILQQLKHAVNHGMLTAFSKRYDRPADFVSSKSAGPDVSAGTASFSVFSSTKVTVAVWPPRVAEVEESNPLPRTIICVPGAAATGVREPTDRTAEPRSTMVRPRSVIR